MPVSSQVRLFGLSNSPTLLIPAMDGDVKVVEAVVVVVVSVEGLHPEVVCVTVTGVIVCLLVGVAGGAVRVSGVCIVFANNPN